MSIDLPPLPYEHNALEPYISKETIEYHYDKHHRGYVNKLNALIKGTALEKKTLEEIIKQTTDQSIFNNAAQVFNHTFYWNSMTAKKQEPNKKTIAALKKDFGSPEKFKEQFIQAATSLFGSGWVWLVQKKDGTLAIKQTSNAGCPIKDGEKPILTCDVWEHAYYIDYRNLRKKYVESWWNLINWDFVEKNLSEAST